MHIIALLSAVAPRTGPGLLRAQDHRGQVPEGGGAGAQAPGLQRGVSPARGRRPTL